MENQEQSQSAKFNSAIAQTQRIADIQSKINQCKINPFIPDIDNLNLYNFEVWHSCLNSLYSEARPKCTEKERDNYEALNRGVIALFKKCPPAKKDGSDKVYFDTEVLEALVLLENLIREYLDIHQLNTPNLKDPSAAMVSN